MEHLIVIIGEDAYLRQEKLNQYLANPLVKEYEVFTFDAQEDHAKLIIQEAQTISFYDAGKIIIIKNSADLEKDAETLTTLMKMFAKPYENVHFILLTNQRSDFNQLMPTLQTHAYIIEVKPLNEQELVEHIKKSLTQLDFKASDTVIKEIIARKNAVMLDIYHEIDKLTLYKQDTKTIELKDVSTLVNADFSASIYDLINAILAQDKTKALNIFEGLFVKDKDGLSILSAMFNKVEDLIYAKRLINLKYTQDEIAKFLAVSLGQAYYLQRDAKKLTFSSLNKMINKITVLDYKLKSSDIDTKSAIQMLMLRSI